MKKVENKQVEEVKDDEAVKELVVLKVTEDDVNYYLQILALMLPDDNRLQPLQKHFVDMIQRRNEDNRK